MSMCSCLIVLYLSFCFIRSAHWRDLSESNARVHTHAHSNRRRRRRKRIVHQCVSKWLVSSYLIVLVLERVKFSFTPSVCYWKCAVLCLFLQMNFTHTNTTGGRIDWISIHLNLSYQLQLLPLQISSRFSLHTNHNEDRISRDEKKKRRFSKEI